MNEESKHIKLKLGNVSHDEFLGSYYIDMRPALVHYTQNIYDGGFDEDGIPWINSNGAKNYFPINICQYGFMVHADYIDAPSEDKLRLLNRITQKLIALQTETENEIIWWHNYHEAKYNIASPWASAMAQGECISFYLRMYQILNDEKLLFYAKKAYQFLINKDDQKSVCVIDKKGYMWLEEYPSEPSSFVLNGFIYAIFGIYDLYRVIKDPEVKKTFDECIKTVVHYLPEFDSGYWSYYDMLKKELVRYYYQQNVHVPQLLVLYHITNEPSLKKYASKWEKQVNVFNYILVQIMYRILPRWRKKSLTIK